MSKQAVYKHGQWAYDAERDSLSVFGIIFNGLSENTRPHILKLLKSEPLEQGTSIDKKRLADELSSQMPPALIQQAISGLPNLVTDNAEATSKVTNCDEPDKAPEPVPDFSISTEPSKFEGMKLTYNKDHNVFYIGEKAFDIPENQRKMLISILDANGKPQSSKNLDLAVFGEVQDDFQARAATYKRLRKTLDKVEAGLSRFLYSDSSGYRVLPYQGPPQVSLLTQSSVIKKGKWFLDSETDLVFYNGQVLDLKPVTHKYYKAAITSYPNGITIDPQDMDVHNINIRFRKKHGTDQSPFYHSLPLEKYILNLSLDEVSEEDGEKMDLRTFGPFTVSVTQARIWVDNEPIGNENNTRKREWAALTYLLDNKGRFISGEEMAKHLYGDTNRQNIENMWGVTSRLKDLIRRLAPKDHDYLYSWREAGYCLCDKYKDYLNLIDQFRSSKKPDPIVAPT